MKERHVSVDRVRIKDEPKSYVIRFWENGEHIHTCYTKSVEYYTVTITDWLDGEDFSIMDK